MNRSVLLALGLAALAGCGDERKAAPTAEKPPVHEHHAPHGGTLVELGEEAAHVELVFDAASGKLTAYVLDGEAEDPVRVAQPSLALRLTPLDDPTASVTHELAVELAAVANPLTGEKVGDTSQFEGASEKLRGARSFGGVLKTITARGVKFDDVSFAFPGGESSKEK